MGKYLFFFFIMLILPSQLYATHIVGGEMSYKQIGVNQYEIHLTLFRDCNHGRADFDNTAKIGLFDGELLIDSISIPFENRRPLVTNASNPCLVQASDSVCFEEGHYSGVITLSSIPPSGLTVAYQRCCRNHDLLNVNSPGNTGISILCTIPPLNNSSPVLSTLPPTALCNNNYFSLDFHATDPDNDSLSYTLSLPLAGTDSMLPIPPVMSFNHPLKTAVSTPAFFSSNNPLGPQSLIKLDPKTGELTGLPINKGQFVAAISVHEYRKGLQISETLRQFEVNVVGCRVSSSVQVSANPSTVQYGDTAVLSCAPTNRFKFLWKYNILSDSTLAEVLVRPGKFTTYYVEVTDTVTSCHFIETISVDVVRCYATMPLTVRPSSNTIHTGEEVSFTGNGNYKSYYAYHFIPPTVQGSLPGVLTASPTTATTYQFYLYDTKHDCNYTSSIPIDVITLCEEPEIFIPNSFTPNGDGVNDVFRVKGNYIESLKLDIYNRWGERIITLDHPDDAWDGQFKSQPLSADVFVYHAEVGCYNGKKPFLKSGNITLLR